jgi:predicted PurR-regulated permease PerM
LVLLLAGGALLTLTPLWPPLVLAAWIAIVAHPLHVRLARKFRGRHRAAALMTVTFVLLLLGPVTALTASLTGRAIELARDIIASQDGKAALRAVVSTSGEGPAPALSFEAFDLESLLRMAQRHGADAWHALSAVAGAATALIVGLFVFVLAIYAFLIHGVEAYDWLVARSPISRAHTHRFANAFSETGRGLLVGVGLTALLQGAAATMGYVALGIHEAFVLGALTAVASIIPSGGAALVWIPVSAALAIGGRPIAAVIMVAIGLVVSTADNFVRPLLTRYGKLRMPTFLLLIAMLGGLALFGGWGMVLGPLLVRLAMEGLEILREEPASASPSP